MARWFRCASGTLVIGLFLSGCASESEVPEMPTIFTADTSDVGQQALIGGKLTLVGGVCFGAEYEGMKYPIIFPAGAGIEADGDRGIRTPSGELVLIGGEFRGSGFMSDASDPYAREAGLPAQCSDYGPVGIMGHFDAP